MKKLFIILLMLLGCGDDAMLPPQQDNGGPEVQSLSGTVVVQVIEIERKLDLLIEYLEKNPINLEKKND